MTSQTQPAASVLVTTANSYFQTFKALDLGSIPLILSDNYKHECAPASLNPPAPFTRDTFTAHLKRLKGALRGFPVHPKQTWPNPSLRQVVIWADSLTEFHQDITNSDNKEDWSFRGEYIFVLTMDEGGERVEHVLEFLDSQKTQEIRALLRKAFKKREELDGTKDHANGGWEM